MTPIDKAFFPAAVLLLLTGCGDMCGNEISQRSASPSGKHVAYVFSRNCGATTEFNTQVSVLPASEDPPTGGGNVFIGSHQIPLVLQWQGDKVLKVSGVTSVIKQEASAEGVQVLYAP